MDNNTRNNDHALVWALDSSRRGNQPSTELYSTDNRAPADGLAGLPKDYTGIPKLGPARREISVDRSCARRRKASPS